MRESLKFGIVATLEDISFPEDTWMDVILQEEIRPPEEECHDGKVLYSSTVELTDDEVDIEFYGWLREMDNFSSDEARVLRLLSLFVKIGFEHGIKYQKQQLTQKIQEEPARKDSPPHDSSDEEQQNWTDFEEGGAQACRE